MLDRMFLLNGTTALPSVLYVEDVFSTYLYTGTGAAQTITNGINLSGEGGMVWVKSRSAATDNFLFDTIRGANAEINSNTTEASTTLANSLTSFNSNGFNVSSADGIGVNAATYASWTFRKAPKFFDVVTYTGTGVNRTIAHNLGATVGCIMIKRTDTSGDWAVYHISNGNTQYQVLNSTIGAGTSSTRWNNTSPTSTAFTVGTNESVNAPTGTYVAYIFAHDAAAGGIIQCGTYIGNSSSNGPDVTLGWEPQWVMIKRASGGGGSWSVMDNMRGMPSSAANAVTQANTAAAETFTNAFVSPEPTGFKITTTSAEVNNASSNYIYIAIRRGPMKTPTLGTDVFSPTLTNTFSTTTFVTTNFPVDLSIGRARATVDSTSVFDRLRGTEFVTSKYLFTNAITVEGTTGAPYGIKYDSNTGFINYWWSGNSVQWNFRRAPSFFDVVCYTGTGSSRTISHNLGVVPELMIVRSRSITNAWQVYSAALANTQYLVLNTTAATASGATRWNSTTPSSTTFSIGSSTTVNSSSATYVAYLFASCAGVSKVGSYTGNGSLQTIDCGFATGARFVMIKRTNSTGDWYVWDTARGIIANSDPRVSLNTTVAEVTTDDTIDPDSSGFVVNQVAATNVNVNAATYIYLAIA